MSSTTWTPAALSSEARELEGECWRVVEAQNRVSTLKLVDSLEEQDALERLIETTKPAIPADCRGLHFLLSTPFRYNAPYPKGSRFRREGRTQGVFYAAEAVHTAIAELAFHRLLFFAESPATPWPENPAEYTAFSVRYRARSALDLTAPPLSADADRWTHPTEYTFCQGLAEMARTAGITAIRYTSVRDPGGGSAVALLSCSAFGENAPKRYQTWRIYLRGSGVQALCEFPVGRIAFGRTTFAADPRIAAMTWDR